MQPQKKVKKQKKFNPFTDFVKVLQGTFCQICYDPTEVVDMNGTWCKRCHKEFTDGLVNPARRPSLVDMIKRHRPEKI